ncbi:hypothetical protein [Phyllobacterium myrsinacearum]|uniref:Uncharacterized protein n=1 Tax=Phyllobacterium myrsinacearum TaxID=28101 RepID=A0A839EN31_9HYPH|nr:hypothetical protein [Phyllobacterium myrsinacearum]MBA8881491.1 hypothetical protein [Phyllobacterium myrsinacearum]
MFSLRNPRAKITSIAASTIGAGGNMGLPAAALGKILRYGLRREIARILSARCLGQYGCKGEIEMPFFDGVKMLDEIEIALLAVSKITTRASAI